MTASRVHARATTIALAMLVLAVMAPAARADYVDDVAEAWNDDPIYVDDGERDVLSASAERDLEERISDGDQPVYIAVLPEEARAEGGGTTVGLLQELAQRQGSTATYAAIVGGQFRAGGTGGATRLADEAFQAERAAGPDAVLADFVTRVQSGEGASGGSRGSSRSGGSGIGGLLTLALLVGGGLLAFRALRRRGGGHRHGTPVPAGIDEMAPEELAEVRSAAQGDLVALGDDIRTMDIEIQLPGASEQAQQRYVGALDSYQKVSAAIDEATTLQEMRPLSGEIARGRYALDCARALLDGKAEPSPRVPCFFDPRHGTSVRDVQWIGPKDEPLKVPACEICADRVEAGRQPDTRTVESHGQQVPYYESPQMGGYYGGFFGGGGGGGSVLTGMLLGSMLGGGGLFGGGGWGSSGGWDSGGGGGFGGGGDFGGDFGGGGDF